MAELLNLHGLAKNLYLLADPVFDRVKERYPITDKETGYHQGDVQGG